MATLRIPPTLFPPSDHWECVPFYIIYTSYSFCLCLVFKRNCVPWFSAWFLCDPDNSISWLSPIYQCFRYQLDTACVWQGKSSTFLLGRSPDWVTACISSLVTLQRRGGEDSFSISQLTNSVHFLTLKCEEVSDIFFHRIQSIWFLTII